MITICSGWRDKDGQLVHTAPLVLVPEDGTGGLPSHGICEACRDAFLERAEVAYRERHAC